MNAGGTCEMSTLVSKTSGKTVLCWKTGSSGLNGNSFATPTATPNCGGPPPDWTTGAWTPDKCSPGVTQQTRTVTCTASCPCSTTVPDNSRPCSGDLYNGNHYLSQCTDLVGNGGVKGVLALIYTKRVCKIHLPSCPAGWTPYTNAAGVAFVQTSSASQKSDKCVGSETRTTGHHYYLDSVLESAKYCPKKKGCPFNPHCDEVTFYANVTDVACY
ncbi:MAG: hypothetical protein EBX52_03520 [Proteobacteria bacterium]|nr:hypothetical protein [Pseudomonadota bacterium]